MKTNHEHFINNQTGERGNALIYVLIAIALFAALSFTMSRQTDSGEAGTLPDERAELYATQIINYAVQAKSTVDQMIFTGTDMNDLDFMLPTDAAFNTPPDINKIYHPAGGGLNPARLPDDAVEQASNNPVPGWYMGRFNNIEWTALGPGNIEGPGGTEAPYEEVILVAYQIKPEICAKINEKINGSTAIPTLDADTRDVLVDDSFYSGGANVELTTELAGSICPECSNMTSLCVENQSQNIYSFYTILADQ